MVILVVDDDTQLVEAIVVSIQFRWPDSVVHTAQTGRDALQLLQAEEPDLVLLDVQLPDQTGYQVLEKLRRLSDVPVLMITARGAEMEQVRGLEMGADDFITKPFGHLALLARIKAALRRTKRSKAEDVPPPASLGALHVDFDRHEIRVGNEPVRLTPLEYRLFYELVRNAGRIMPHQVLLDRVWGPDWGATRNDLKVMVSHLRAKIEHAVGTRCILNERGVGYRFIDLDEVAVQGAPAERFTEP